MGIAWNTLFWNNLLSERSNFTKKSVHMGTYSLQHFRFILKLTVDYLPHVDKSEASQSALRQEWYVAMSALDQSPSQFPTAVEQYLLPHFLEPLPQEPTSCSGC